MSSLLELWLESTNGSPWAELNVERELTLINELAVKPRIPDDHLIFRIFRAFSDPQRQIKIVLLGQDPYPEMLSVPSAGADQDDPRSAEEINPMMFVSRACGFSFSSPLGKLPVSLNTVFREILREFPQPSVESGGKRAPRAAKASDYSGDLSYLIADGVFLLNTYLTLLFNGTKGLGASHTCWITFTTQILKYIRRLCPKAVYLALGKKAVDLMKGSGINDAIECEHPANRFGGRNPFAGSDIFIKANTLLEKRGIRKIDWIPMKKAVDLKYYDRSLVTMRVPVMTSVAPLPVIVEDQQDDEDEFSDDDSTC